MTTVTGALSPFGPTSRVRLEVLGGRQGIWAGVKVSVVSHAGPRETYFTCLTRDYPFVGVPDTYEGCRSHTSGDLSGVVLGVFG